MRFRERFYRFKKNKFTVSTMKISLVFLFLTCFCLSFSQVETKRDDFIVFLDLKSKGLREYTISKDTVSAHFSIYIKKYESKKERDKSTEIYDDWIKNR